MTQRMQAHTSASCDNAQHDPLHFSVCRYDVMKRCWEEKPQSRPSFSLLLIAMGNMLTDDYKQVPTPASGKHHTPPDPGDADHVVVCQRYLQIAEDFLKGGNPAVHRYKQSLSRGAEEQEDTHGNTHSNTDTNTVTHSRTVTHTVAHAVTLIRTYKNKITQRHTRTHTVIHTQTHTH